MGPSGLHLNDCDLGETWAFVEGRKMRVLV